MPSQKKGGGSKLRRQVRRDVRAAYRPVLQSLNKQQDIALEDSEADQARLRAIYDRFNTQFQPLLSDFGTASQGILAGTQGALGSMTGKGMEAGIGGLLGALGQGYAAQLGTGLQGSLANVAAGQTAANLQAADLDANILSKYRDMVNDISLQKGDVKAQRAAQILDEMNRRREFRLAKKEQQLRAEQFDKEFRHRNQEDNEDDQNQQEMTKWVINQAEKEQLDTIINKMRNRLGVADLSSQIQSIRDQINSGNLDPAQVNVLNDKLAALVAERNKARKRIKERKRKFKKRHGEKA